MNARFVSLWTSALSGALVACACGSAPPAASTARTPAATTAPADYEVHEWGLVRGDVGDTQHFGAIGPPMSYAMMAVDKPVLYFHTTSALTLARVTVEARSGGTLIETWPLTPLGTTASWTSVTLDPSGACTPSPLPLATDPPCSTLGAAQLCESAALDVVRTDDAACVHVGSSTERFLFYRGRARTFTPPLRFERTGAYEVVRVTNEGDAPIPGRIVRLWSDTFHVRTLAIAPPAPHQSIDVHADFDAAAADHPVAADETDRRGSDDLLATPASGPGRQTLIDTMREIGLTPSESDAFLRAWDAPLFGPGQPQLDALSADGEPAPRESFVYFLPASSADEVAHLELDPPPRGGVHRAIAMWSMLGATGATH